MNSFLYKFSIFTIFIGFVHFILETAFTIRFGQTVAGYLPGLIAVPKRIILESTNFNLRIHSSLY